MKQRIRKNRLATIILRVAIVLVFIGAVMLAFHIFMPGLEPLLKKGNEEEIVAYLEETGGIAGAVSVFVLQIMQVVSVVIPGLAVQIAAGIIYGWWKGFLLCYTGFIAGNTGIFLFARKAHGQVELPADGGSGKLRWVISKMKGKDPRFAISVGYLVPGVPNGMLPYIAARSSVSTWGFISAVAMSSWIQIVFNCLAGGFIIQGKYGFFALTIVLQVGLILFILWKRGWLNMAMLRRIAGILRRKEEETEQDADT